MADRVERIKVTNNAPGPRTIYTATGGHTLAKRESKTIPLTENDFKAIKPYVDLGHFALSEPDPETDLSPEDFQDLGGGEPAPRSRGDIMPINQVEEADDDDQSTAEDDLNGPDSTDGDLGDDSQAAQAEKPTHIEHRGFGRWYGMNGEERITGAMTEAEADAYAEEQGIIKKTASDPSEETETVTEVVEEAPASADETVTED